MSFFSISFKKSLSIPKEKGLLENKSVNRSSRIAPFPPSVGPNGLIRTAAASNIRLKLIFMWNNLSFWTHATYLKNGFYGTLTLKTTTNALTICGLMWRAVMPCLSYDPPCIRLNPTASRAECPELPLLNSSWLTSH